MLWGGLAASSLVFGTWIAVRFNPSERVTGLVMGFGAGALIGSIAYDLMPDSSISGGSWRLLVAFALGAVTFFAGDWIVDNRGGSDRKRIDGESQVGGSSGRAIFLGTLLDGLPESLVLGIGLALSAVNAEGAATLAFLCAVFISNIPEAIAGTSSMLSEGYSARRVYGMWLALVLASAVTAAFGFAFASRAPSVDGALAQAFAAGAMLTMLADTMMPEAYEHGGKVVGLMTTLGFLLAAILSLLE
jgi:ZIP family zinc transporter